MRQPLILSCLACLLAASGVVAGAIAAHWTMIVKSDAGQSAAWLETASRYQLWHALAILSFANIRQVKLVMPAWLMLVGTVIFCGSLYLLALETISSAAAAPYGGGAIIIAWLWAAINCLTKAVSSTAEDSSSR